MLCVETLKREHELIRRFLQVLTEITKILVTGKQIEMDSLQKTLAFARSFADQYHHYKEEYLLFGYLAQKNQGRIDKEISRLRDQHEHLRSLLAEISSALSGYDAGKDFPARILHRNFTEYVQTLRQHIRQEEHILFHLIEEELTKDEDSRLAESFEGYEKKLPGKDHTTFELELSELEKVFA